MKFANDFRSRQPENLQELHDFIIYQLRTSDKVTINLADGDDLHELLESLTDGMRGTRALNDAELNKNSSKIGFDHHLHDLLEMEG